MVISTTTATTPQISCLLGFLRAQQLSDYNAGKYKLGNVCTKGLCKQV